MSDKKIIDATAIRHNKATELKYLGGEWEGCGVTDYFPNGDVQEAFRSLSVGRKVLAIGILYNKLPDGLYPVFEKNSTRIEAFINKWYHPQLTSELKNDIFHFFDLDQWDADDEEGKVYVNENGVKLLFQEPVSIADWPVFVKKEYYNELINDLSLLEKHILSTIQ